jgi:hypothetical protein
LFILAAKETDTHKMELQEDSASTTKESHGVTDTGMYKNLFKTW